MSLWRTIAKKEIWLKTSRFRRKRKLFFLIIYGIFLFWAAYLGPILLDSIIPEFFKSYSNSFEDLFVVIIENSLASLFLMNFIFPLFLLLRKEKSNESEIILQTPIKAGDLFLGEFFGSLPFYFLFILGIGPFFSALLMQLSIELTLFHHLLIYLIILVSYISGSLLGRFLAHWIEYKMNSIGKLKGVENLLIIIIAFSVVGLYSLFQIFFGHLKANRGLRGFFIIFPSFWYSNMILYLSSLEASIFNIWLDLSLAILFPLLLFYVSYKKVKFLIYLDNNTNKEVESRKMEFIYQIIRKITPKKQRGLVVIQFKNFLRKRENKIKIIYLVSLISMFGIILYLFLRDQTMIYENFLFEVSLVIQITFDKELVMLVISWMSGLIFGILMGMSIYFESKEILEIYKKSPNGVRAFLYSHLYVTIYQLVLMSTFFSILFTIIFQLNLIITLIFFITLILNGEIILLQSIGVQFIRPLFLERRKNLVFNNYLIVVLQVISFLLTLYLFIPFINELSSTSINLSLIMFINTGISFLLALLILFIGMRRIRNFE